MFLQHHESIGPHSETPFAKSGYLSVIQIRKNTLTVIYDNEIVARPLIFKEMHRLCVHFSVFYWIT